jgi:lipoprotein NlpI
MNVFALRALRGARGACLQGVLCSCSVWLGLAASASSAAADEAESQLRDAARRLAEKDADGALASATASLAARPTTAGYQLRASIHSRAGRHAEAVTDLNASIKLSPKDATAYARRGEEHFMLGEFKQSVADFDEQISLAPGSEPGHWQRGISCYYAGEYTKGAKQFAFYHTKVDDNDVENSIWRCMCMARESGLEKARAEMLVVKHDRRVAMMEAYQMFAGKIEPDAVLKAAQADASPEQLNQQQFYANLYVGLFYDLTGRPDLARSYLRAAESHRIDHYMWEVARVHADVLGKRP